MAKKIDLNGLDHFKEKENAMIASEYSSSKTYAVGDYCYHAGTLYCCTTAIITAENWTAGHWTAAKLADDTSALKTALNDVISEDLKTALLQIASKVAYIDGSGESYYDSLYDALYPQAPIYPMVNGTHTFSVGEYSGTSIKVTGNHVEYNNPDGGTQTLSGAYVILDNITDNLTIPSTTNITTPTATLFTLPTGKTIELQITNIIYDGFGTDISRKKYAIALRSQSTSIVSTGDISPSESSKTVSTTLNADSNITCVFLYAGMDVRKVEFDIQVFVDGARWI